MTDIQPPPSSAPAAKGADTTACVWRQDEYDSDTYATGCGRYFIVNTDTPAENGFKFCFYCGKSLQQELWRWPDEPDTDEVDADSVSAPSVSARGVGI